MARGWFRVLVVVGVALAALATCALLPASEQPFFDYVAERRAAGLATTFEDLVGPMPPDAENGGPDLDAAMKWLVAEHGPRSSWKQSAYDNSLTIPDWGTWPDCLTPAQFAELADAAARIRPWSERRDAALAKPHLRLPMRLDFEGMPMSDVVPLAQDVQRVLAIQAAADADPAQRLAACRAALVLARRLEKDSLMQGMVANACAGGAVTGLRFQIERGLCDPAAARAACDELLTGDPTEDARRGLRGFAVEVLDQYGGILDGRVVPPATKGSWWKRMERRADALWSKVRGRPVRLEAERGMAPTIVDVCRGLDAAAAADAKWLAGETSVAGLEHADALIGVGFGRFPQKLMRSAYRLSAISRLARVAMAAAEHRAKHGDFPASLDELKWAFPDGVPLDPYTGSAFVYAPSETGVRIESPGPPPGEGAGIDISLRERCLVWELKR